MTLVFKCESMDRVNLDSVQWCKITLKPLYIPTVWSGGPNDGQTVNAVTENHCLGLNGPLGSFEFTTADKYFMDQFKVGEIYHLHMAHSSMTPQKYAEFRTK